jgi:hypothetical protein
METAAAADGLHLWSCCSCNSNAFYDYINLGIKWLPLLDKIPLPKLGKMHLK